MLEADAPSVTLLEKGETRTVARHPNFYLYSGDQDAPARPVPYHRFWREVPDRAGRVRGVVDIDKYTGSRMTCVSSDNPRFEEGILVQAVRCSWWVILDELNLAPSEVLEALNRLLDDNREQVIAETQTMIEQNPTGMYGGRKQLNRAFKEEIHSAKLVDILHKRCGVGVFAECMVCHGGAAGDARA